MLTSDPNMAVSGHSWRNLGSSIVRSELKAQKQLQVYVSSIKGVFESAAGQ
jgi:hypothetical protein